eukprot:gene11830-8139_t
MGVGPSAFSSDAKFRFKVFVTSIYKKDEAGNYVFDEEALSKLKSYAAHNPERIPRICRKISKIMHQHLTHSPPQVQRVLISVKAMYALIADAEAVDAFVPHVIEMVAQLFAMKRYPYYMSGADLITVLCMKLVKTNAHTNTRRLLKDNGARLLPHLHHMIGSTTLLHDSLESPPSGSNARSPMASAARAGQTTSPAAREQCEEDPHLHLTYDPALSRNAALLSGGLTAIGNLAFCVPDMAQDLMGRKTLKIIVRHILHTVRHGVYLQKATHNGGLDAPLTSPLQSHLPNFLPTPADRPRTESTAVFTSEETSEQEQMMLVVQRSALHALRALASAVPASWVDALIRMVLECFEEDGPEGAWRLHAAVDLIFHALARSLELQSQRLGMSLCTAVAYVIFLGKAQLQVPPSSPVLRRSRSAGHPLGPFSVGTEAHGEDPLQQGETLHSFGAQQDSAFSSRPDSTRSGFLPAMAAAAAAAAASARPPVLPEEIPKAFASPAALGGLLRALHQCLLVIPMTGTRPHVFLGAIQVLLVETPFLANHAPEALSPSHAPNSLAQHLPASPDEPVQLTSSVFLDGHQRPSIAQGSPRQQYAFQTSEGSLTSSQPFDVVVISLTTALLAAIHSQQNYPALHLILSFLAETCSETLLGRSTSSSSTGSGKPKGGRRVRMFMLRLLQSTAAYFRVIPDAQRRDVDLFVGISPTLYDLRQTRTLALATSIVCQLLAGRPPTRWILPCSTGRDAQDEKQPTTTIAVQPPSSVSLPARDEIKKSRSVLSASNQSSAPTALHTSLLDVQRAQEWILFLCHARREDVTPRLLVELGNVLSSYMAGYGAQAIPFVLRLAWNLYVRYGGCCVDDVNHSKEDRNEEEVVREASEELHKNSEQNRAWQQFVVAILAHVGVVFEIDPLIEYTAGIWEQKRIQGELSHCLSKELKTSWTAETDGLENRFVECGLKLAVPPPGSPGGSAHALLWRGDKPLSELDPPSTPSSPHQGAQTAAVRLSFIHIARLLAHTPREDIEGVFGCVVIQEEDEETLVEAIVVRCFSTAAMEESEAEAAAAATRGEPSPHSSEPPPQAACPNNGVPHLSSPASPTTPVGAVASNGAGHATLGTVHSGISNSANQLTSMEYLVLVEELANSAHRRRQAAPVREEMRDNNASSSRSEFQAAPSYPLGDGKKVKFALGDRDQIRKTLVSYDKKDLSQLVRSAADAGGPAVRNADAQIPTNKIEQLFRYYDVDPLASLFDLGLFVPPADRVAARVAATAAAASAAARTDTDGDTSCRIDPLSSPALHSPRTRLRLRLSVADEEEEEAEEEGLDPLKVAARLPGRGPSPSAVESAGRPFGPSGSTGNFSSDGALSPSSQLPPQGPLKGSGRGLAGSGSSGFPPAAPSGGSLQRSVSRSNSVQVHDFSTPRRSAAGLRHSRSRGAATTMWPDTLDKTAVLAAMQAVEGDGAAAGAGGAVDGTWVSQLPMWQYLKHTEANDTTDMH